MRFAADVPRCVRCALQKASHKGSHNIVTAGGQLHGRYTPPRGCDAITAAQMLSIDQFNFGLLEREKVTAVVAFLSGDMFPVLDPSCRAPSTLAANGTVSRPGRAAFSRSFFFLAG